MYMHVTLPPKMRVEEAQSTGVHGIRTCIAYSLLLSCRYSLWILGCFVLASPESRRDTLDNPVV